MNDSIVIIKADITSVSPLYIGDGNEEPLTYDEIAYIPATSIAGAFKAYLKFIKKDYQKLFGGNDGKGENSTSNVIVKDSFAKIVDYHRRSGIVVDDRYGSPEEKKKFERTYLQEGLKFKMEFKIQASKEEIKELKEMLYICLKALNEGIIRLGGNKSDGLGIFKIDNIEEVNYDLSSTDGLMKYLNNDLEDKVNITNYIMSRKIDNHHVLFTVKGHFTTPLIISGVDKLDSDDVDVRSIGYKNLDDEFQYIIPGSSFKGILRSRMEKIANYFNTLEEAKEIFGELKEDNSITMKKNNVLSRVFIRESKIEDVKEVKYNRIKIDRFTGGVMYSSLMDEIPIKGATQFNIMYRKKDDEKIDDYAVGLITLALRDLSTENLTLGGNSNIGRGRFKAEKMVVNDGDINIEVDFKNRVISNKERLDKYVKGVKSFKDKEGGDE